MAKKTEKKQEKILKLQNRANLSLVHAMILDAELAFIRELGIAAEAFLAYKEKVDKKR